MTDTIEQIKFADIANKINEQIKAFTHQEIVERSKPNKPFDLDWDYDGFTLFITHDDDIDYSVAFKANTDRTEYGNDLIIEYSDIKLHEIEVDSTEHGAYLLETDDDVTALIAVANKVIHDATFYKLVDDVTLTLDTDAAKQELYRYWVVNG